ncbi:MAG: hypothetical protein WEH44_08930, partial [Pirellulaceae bacterium]
MIISHKYKFIFIKTRKTAGTSLEVFLSQCCSDRDILTPVWPHVEPHVPRNYRGLWNPLPELLDSPVPGVESTLRELVKRRKFFNHIPARLLQNRIARRIWNTYYKFCVDRNPWDKTLSHYSMRKDRSGGHLTLDEYFARQHFCLNHPLYVDRRGRLLVDRVVKFESLKEELSEIFARLGVPFAGDLGVKAKSEHRRDRRPYQEVFSQQQRTVI